MEELHRNYIAGEWREGEAAPNVNPSDTSDVIGHYARATAADAEAEAIRKRAQAEAEAEQARAAEGAKTSSPITRVSHNLCSVI